MQKIFWRRMLAGLAAVSLSLAGMPVVQAELEEKSAMQVYVEEMGMGWNLGNTFDATGGETSWGNPVTTREMIQEVADSGFKSLRLPVTWGYQTDETQGYQISEAYMDRVQEVADWALDAGMKVMLNLHHDSEWILEGIAENHDEVMRKYEAIWTQIAERFKDYPDTLMFETINEPRFSDDWGEDREEYFQWAEELNLSAYEIIRSSGGNNATRPIVMPTITCSTQQVRMDALAETIAGLNDPNIIATIHYYSVWQFSVNVTGQLHFDEAMQKDIVDIFDRAYDTFVSKGIPVVVGELGLLAPGAVEDGEAMKYYEFVAHYAHQKNIGLMLWDPGLHMDRETLTWDRYPSPRQVLMDSLQGIRSSHAETDYIYIKEGTEPADVTLALTLFGNQLTGVRNGDQMLEEGKDYQLSEDGQAITFKADYLRSVTEGMTEYGQAARLFLEFSQGADWLLDLMYYKPAALASNEDMAYDFDIRTQFNGDWLWTMEAFYTDTNKPAGTITYSTYQLCRTDYQPDYEAQKIVVLKAFWDACPRSGEILLRFHFRSGEIIDYTVDFNKEATWVTGVSSNEYEIDYPGKNESQPSQESADDATSQTGSEDTSSSGESSGADGSGLAIHPAVLVGIVAALLVLAALFWGYSRSRKRK